MPNPQGYNGIDPVDAPYGDVQRQDSMERLAPKSGGPAAASAKNAPRRAQRRAVRGAPAPEDAGPPAPPAGTTAIPAALTFWQQAALLPGASPLVIEMANG